MNRREPCPYTHPNEAKGTSKPEAPLTDVKVVLPPAMVSVSDQSDQSSASTAVGVSPRSSIEDDCGVTGHRSHQQRRTGWGRVQAWDDTWLAKKLCSGEFAMSSMEKNFRAKRSTES